ncbi:MAG: DUF4197 domain-containing protein [Blastomonas sp.]
MNIRAGRLLLETSCALGMALAVPALAMLAVSPVHAAWQGSSKSGFSVKGLLGNASDSALDKLSQPGAFYADKAVRILLPGPLKKAGKLLKFTSKAGLTGDLTRSINDAAGLAAQEAKPVFRAAIDEMTLSDGVGIVTGGDTAATDYLKRTSGGVLRGKLRPLIVTALGEAGAYEQLDRLGSLKQLSRLGGLDLSHDGLTDSVTDQALSGIFAYIGSEEARVRSDPIGKGKKLLEGIL